MIQNTLEIFLVYTCGVLFWLFYPFLMLVVVVMSAITLTLSVIDDCIDRNTQNVLGYIKDYGEFVKSFHEMFWEVMTFKG